MFLTSIGYTTATQQLPARIAKSRNRTSGKSRQRLIISLRFLVMESLHLAPRGEITLSFSGPTMVEASPCYWCEGFTGISE